MSISLKVTCYYFNTFLLVTVSSIWYHQSNKQIVCMSDCNIDHENGVTCDATPGNCKITITFPVNKTQRLVKCQLGHLGQHFLLF